MTDEVQILLVEDNPNDAKLALHAFKQHNLANHVHIARDGAEALDLIFCTGEFAHRKIENGPKVILLDLKLPLVDGVEVLRRIKSDPRTQPIPVIVLTSSREDRDIVESYRLGVNSYIVKPVDFDQFTEAVRHLGFYWLLLNQGPMPASATRRNMMLLDEPLTAITAKSPHGSAPPTRPILIEYPRRGIACALDERDNHRGPRNEPALSGDFDCVMFKNLFVLGIPCAKKDDDRHAWQFRVAFRSAKVRSFAERKTTLRLPETA